MNHMPWDNGSILDALEDVFGFRNPQKTTKTRCGIRVSMSKADHRAAITCPGCEADIRRENDFLEANREQLEALRKLRQLTEQVPA